MTSSAIARSTRHIIWDWNGTLLDDNDAVVAAVNKVCAAFGCEHIDLERWRAVFGRPLHRSYEHVLGRALGEHDWTRIEKLYHDAYRELLPTCGLAHGVPEKLRAWIDSGRTQSLLSMWFHDELVPLVETFGLNALFTRIDGLRAEIGGGSKADCLTEHVTVLGIDPAETVLIGDVADDAHAAERVGADCVLLTTGVMARPALEATGFPVVDSITEALETVEAEAAA
ncbi:phosphoglycolate phosphatase-like HAD superfamily hydrolase [Halopolyspora algeriensis]|uniref:Phosphoglycolate phosphatase-like HAD superfamily hydrolase n=1 Tax=Halopolyspora algeriensis TaxID=1500506 RepID=A0A368VQY0_9ACTN|nr:HAD family hydrolase [Halopolyspora algeriensis]RCW44028.1 phosphoglycolate phosphatase-like HAD superfamily hydrolase [Halopolyspora algeriensis]TQM53469.1 phosphoglycolate phosphatase-like HAD superfamily hydrolase [Halopolyspora algeriensis]